MKKVIMFLAVLVVASAGVVGSAQAQTDGTEIANVPFDFYAGGQKMPAGTYTIGIDLEDEHGEWDEYMVENEIFGMFRGNPYMDAAYVHVKEDPS